MLPTNVVSFVKKMVTSDGSSSSTTGLSRGRSSYRSETAEAGTTLSKLRHTLTSGIHGTGATGGMSSHSLSSTSTVSIEERSLLQKVWDKTEKYEPSDQRRASYAPPISTPTAPVGGTFSPLNPAVNDARAAVTSLIPKILRPPGSSCRVCVKSISTSEYFKRCSECNQKVCEDCASYSSSKDDSMDSWHCSICRRKLLSRVKKDVPDANIKQSSNSAISQKIEDIPDNAGVKIPATQTLMSNIASMATPLASFQTSSSNNRHTTSTASTELSAAHSKVKITSTANTNIITGKTEEQNNIITRKDSRRGSSRINNQRSFDKSESEDVKDRRPSILRHNKEQNQHIRRVSQLENDVDNPQLSYSRRGLLKTKNEHPGRLNESKSTSSSIEKKESSEEALPSNGRKRRTKSIVRQQSYDEDGEDSSLLTLWATGQLPTRRHSAQDPSRRSDHPDFERSKESLDVPQGRIHRHHSWDYDSTRGSTSIHEALLPNANPAQVSHFSSESDMSNESMSERGSMVTLVDEQKRKPSTIRRSSYRGMKVEEPINAEYSSKGSLDTSVKTNEKKTGISSLDEDPWLYLKEDEWNSSRRRSSAVSDSGRVLPTPPASPRISTYCSWGSGSSGAYGRSSQSFESNSSRDKGDETLRKQGSVTDGEAIKIVIHDVDTPSKATENNDRRRVTIKRNVSSNRGGGLGMRIVGGKTSKDGKLMATVVWTVPGGPAQCAGVRQGDKVLEWNGVNLINRSFEDVCSIIEADENNDKIDVLLENGGESFVEGKDDNPLIQSQKNSFETRLSLDGDLEKSLISVSRRKLPKIPGDLLKSPVSGKIQIQLWYDKQNLQLIVTVISAHDLRHRDGYTSPEAFVCLRLFPHFDSSVYTTPVADPTTKPLWNSSFLWESIFGDGLMGMTLEITIWDSILDKENGFLGECLLDLRHSYLDERPTWYRLQERRSRSANTTPRGSIAGGDFVMTTIRRPSSVKSGTEDFHDGDDSRHSSIDSGLLHPDLAWRDSRSNSRRGSSLSEQAENEIYQLTRSYPHSLPQSRRSSLVQPSGGSPEFKAEDLEARLSGLDKPPTERRRANSCRVSSQKELLEEAGWKNIGQTPHWLSSSTTVHHGNYTNSNRYSSSSRSRSGSLVGGGVDQLTHSKGSVKFQREDEEIHQTWRSNLGPGQVVPRAYRDILTDDFTLGEIRLELSQTRGYLEVEVSNARGLPAADSGQPPDTYVKMYLKDGDRRLHKRKTRVIRQSRTPNFYQTLRYPTQELRRRTLLVMVWEAQRHKHVGLGVAEIAVQKLELRRPTTGWYRLLPLSSVDRVQDSDSE